MNLVYSGFRQNIKRSDLYQYRLQAWTITDMQEMYLPDFAQSKSFNPMTDLVFNYVKNCMYLNFQIGEI